MWEGFSGSVFVPNLNNSDESYMTAFQRWTTVLTDGELSDFPTTRNYAVGQARLNSYEFLKEW